MPITTEPLDALVSIWKSSSGDIATATPIGSGMFIAPRYVLTAKHVVEAARTPDGKVWLGNVKDKHSQVPVTAIQPHPKLDIALLDLEFANDRQPWCRVDISQRDVKGQQVDLYGVLPPEKESIPILNRAVLTHQNEHGLYVIDYRQAEGFSGGMAVMAGYIVGVINTRYKAEAHGCFIPLSAAGAWLAEVAALQSSLLTSERRPALERSQASVLSVEFARKVKNAIRELLSRGDAGRTLCKAIEQQAGGNQKAEDVLVPSPPASLLEALHAMYHATASCLQKLREEDSSRLEQAKKIAEEVCGWQVVLAVDHDQVQSAGITLDPRKTQITLQSLPMETAAASEILLSSRGDRAAWFRQLGADVMGRDGFTVGDLEEGIGHEDALLGALKRIWVHVMKVDPPLPFDAKRQKALQATLHERALLKKNYYYVLVPPGHEQAAPADLALLERLLKTLPSLCVMCLRGEESEGLLVLGEYQLQAFILEFLQMLRDTV